MKSEYLIDEEIFDKDYRLESEKVEYILDYYYKFGSNVDEIIGHYLARTLIEECDVVRGDLDFLYISHYSTDKNYVVEIKDLQDWLQYKYGFFVNKKHIEIAMTYIFEEIEMFNIFVRESGDKKIQYWSKKNK